jgi:trimethylamine--corrinoid protein Co-methyltransferase
MLELGVTFDYSQLLIGGDIAEMILYSLGGIPVNDESLAVEDIKEVGSFRDFLTHKSTMKHLRSQSFAPVSDRRMRHKWLESGGKDMTQRARERAKEILTSHKPLPIPEAARKEIREIIHDQERKRGLSPSPDLAA